MLLNDFFYIEKLSHVDQKIIAEIAVNANHDILKGHFPVQPIVPGVCMLEMIKEILEVSFSKKWILGESSLTKFLNLFSTERHTTACFEMDIVNNGDGKINVSAILKNKSTIFLKFKGTYSEKK